MAQYIYTRPKSIYIVRLPYTEQPIYFTNQKRATQVAHDNLGSVTIQICETAALDNAFCTICDRPSNDCACVENGGSY